jgi:ArsR family metal-binding transcriptional regulator
MKTLTTFPRISEFEKAVEILKTGKYPYLEIHPYPYYSKVGVSSLATTLEGRSAIQENQTVITSGWIDYRPIESQIPKNKPNDFAEDLFGNAAIMVLSVCVADENKIRLIAHISGNLSPAFPYMNSEMPQAAFNIDGPTFFYMDQYRMITLYSNRIAVAKADDLLDGWRILEKIRCTANEIWARRSMITPSSELRKKPPALEIYFRLPRTNCRQCEEKTCMAFALKLWTGNAQPGACKPIFTGEYQHLKDAFLQVCHGLGYFAGDSTDD